MTSAKPALMCTVICNTFEGNHKTKNKTITTENNTTYVWYGPINEHTVLMSQSFFFNLYQGPL